MQHTEETITDIIIEAHDIIRLIWRGWEKQAIQKVIDDKKWAETLRASRRRRIGYGISTRHIEYAESPQQRGARMRAHNDCIQANGYGSSYF